MKSVPVRSNAKHRHGVFAPHSRWRAEVTPAGRGKATATDRRTPAERHRAKTWAQRLKRVFGIEIETCETCETCGGKVKVMASIEDPAVIGADPRAPGLAGVGGGGGAVGAGAAAGRA